MSTWLIDLFPICAKCGVTELKTMGDKGLTRDQVAIHEF